MRNSIIENAIDQVINESKLSEDAKSVFIKFIKNKFDDNVDDNDLETVLKCIETEKEEEDYYEDVNT